MASRRALERRLATLDGFTSPRLDLEQYPTPAGLAAHLVHLADLRGDVQDQLVVDLGAGTGVLAVGAALRRARYVVGIERDRSAVQIATENANVIDLPSPIDWLVADAADVPLCPSEPITVVMNPPFGAQQENAHADRAFLQSAARIAGVSYSIHNADSLAFVDAFASDHGGKVTDAFASTIPLDRTFEHQREDRREIDVEVYRIEWDR